jgi:hypothetical protein
MTKRVMTTRATVAYGNGELEASERDDVWTVRLANLEVRARYLDLALAELLGSAPEAHRAAARLLLELADVVEQQKTAELPVARAPRRERRRAPRRRRDVWPRPLLVGFRIVAFAVVASTAFMLTTWLSALR